MENLKQIAMMVGAIVLALVLYDMAIKPTVSMLSKAKDTSSSKEDKKKA